AADQQIEFLVGATEFDVSLERNRVVPLRQGVEKLVNGDWFLFLKALVKILALEHLRNREFRRQANEVLGGELLKPAAVEIHDRFLRIEDFEDLLLIGLRVAFDIFAGERRARDRA